MMSTELASSNAVEQYLKRLRRALRHVRREDRDDCLRLISEHLFESGFHDDSLGELIHRLGSPEALAHEFYVAERAKLSEPERFARWLRRWWAAVISVAVLIAVILLYSWASSYQPLSAYMNGSYQDKVAVFSGTPPVKLVGGFAAPITWKLTDGRYRLTILFDASNMNSLSVGISPPDFANGFPLPETWHLENSRTGALTPFDDAQVKGHDSRQILFSDTYVCTPWPKNNPNANAPSATFITSLPVVESFWGFQHTVELAVQPFYLEFAGNCFSS